MWRWGLYVTPYALPDNISGAQFRLSFSNVLDHPLLLPYPTHKVTPPAICLPLDPHQAFPRFSRRCRRRALATSCWRSCSSTAATTYRRRCTAPSSAAASTSPARRPSSSSGCSTRKVSAGSAAKAKAGMLKIQRPQHVFVFFLNWNSTPSEFASWLKIRSMNGN